MNKTYFEDLSNELWYEIFDFLDQYYLYQTLANLNTRLHHLIIHSSLHLKINLSNISTSMFNQRCKYILAPNIQRIVALSISNNMPIDHFLNMLPLNTSFHRLESLTLNKIKMTTLVSLLPDLALLPRLFPLSIMLNDYMIDEKLILRLSVLKYEKFLFGIYDQSFRLPIAVNKHDQCFTIRHLTINGSYRFDQLIAILSYTAQLNRLSCQFLNESVNLETHQPIVFSNIIYLRIACCTSSFDQFELFIANYFPKLQLLHMATYQNKTYFGRLSMGAIDYTIYSAFTSI